MAPFPPLRKGWKIFANTCRQRLPGQLIVQITDRCNATCPHCGMRVTSHFSRSDLPLDTVKRIIDAAAENGVEALSFTGGEPLLRLDDLCEMIRHAGAAGIPFIRTGTNGFFLRHNGDNERFTRRVTTVVEKLAATPLRNFWISLDSSVPEVHEEMRGLPGVIRGMGKALPIFHEHGLYPAVNLGINRNLGGDLTAQMAAREFSSESDYLQAFERNYQKGLHRFYQRVLNLGFTMLNTCYPMSVETCPEKNTQAVYAATSADHIVRFSPAEKGILFKVLMEGVRSFRSRLRVFSPLLSLYTLHRHYENTLPPKHPSSGCRGGIDYFFVDARCGDTYPCGYRGDENLGKYWDLNLGKMNWRANCRRCDWECFRDPSEQFAPFMQVLSAPTGLMHRYLHDRHYLRLWLTDLRYYRACEFFNGRHAPRYDRLAPYALKG